MLVHEAHARAEELARHWACIGCLVVVHVDRAVPASAHHAFRTRLADLSGMLLSAPRHRCE